MFGSTVSTYIVPCTVVPTEPDGVIITSIVPVSPGFNVSGVLESAATGASLCAFATAASYAWQIARIRAACARLEVESPAAQKSPSAVVVAPKWVAGRAPDARCKRGTYVPSHDGFVHDDAA